METLTVYDSIINISISYTTNKVIQTTSSHLSTETNHTQKSAHNKFASFCKSLKTSPYTCKLNTIS